MRYLFFARPNFITISTQNGSVNTINPDISGTATSNSIVNVSDGVNSGITASDGNGNWTFTVPNSWGWTDFNNYIVTASIPNTTSVNVTLKVNIVQPLQYYVPDNTISDMISVGTDTIYMGGDFTGFRVTARPNAATILSSNAKNPYVGLGSNFPVFNNGSIRASAFLDSNTLFVGGDFTSVNGVAVNGLAKLIRVNGIWTIDPSWNSSVGVTGGTIYEIIIEGTSIWLFGGFTRVIDSLGTNTIMAGNVKLNAITGVKDTGYTSSFGNGYVKKVISFNGYFYLSGIYNSVGNSGGRAYQMIKISKTTGARAPEWKNITFETNYVSYLTYGAQSISATGDSIYLGLNSGTILVNGVNYTSAAAVYKLSAYDGTLDTNFTSSVGTTVYDIIATSDGVYCCGTFSQRIKKIDALTGADISSFNAGNVGKRYGQLSSVQKLILSGSTLYAFGQFSGQGASSDPVTCLNAVALDSSTGSIISTFASKDRKAAVARDIIYNAIIDGTNIIILGSFSAWDAYETVGVAKFSKDATTGKWMIDPNFISNNGSTGVKTLCYLDGGLYLGGTFTSWNGQPRNRIAKLDASTGQLDSTFAVGVYGAGTFNGVNSTVIRIKADATDLIVAGAFTAYSKATAINTTTNISTPNWIRVNPTTNIESVPTYGSNGEIHDFVIEDNNIWFTGYFTYWGAAKRWKIVKCTNKLTGTVDTTFNSTSYILGDYPYPLGTGRRLLICDSNLFVFYSSFGSTQNSARNLARIDKTTGGSKVNYTLPSNGTSPYQVDLEFAGTFFLTNDYIYHAFSSFSTTAGIYVASLYRINRTTLTQDANTTWGFYSINTHAYYKSGVLIGNEFIIGGRTDGTSATAIGTPYKWLWDYSLTTATETVGVI